MRVLVTGGTGFMGTYLVPMLLSQGHKVKLFVRNVHKAHELFGDRCEIVQGNIEDKNTLEGLCDGIEIVYHMAALMGHDAPSKEAFEKFRKVNVEGVQNIIDISKKGHVKKFIYISSTAAIGLQHVVNIDEETECKPYTPYQVTKREAELLIINEVTRNQFPALIVRPSMVYGPGFKGDFLTIAKVCKSGFFPRIGRGKNLSPALYIEDLATALSKFIDYGKVGEIYLLSSGQSYALEDTVRIIAKAMGKRIHYVYIPKFMELLGAQMLERTYGMLGKKPPVTKRNIESILQDRIIDISKMCKELDFVPEITLSEGLPKTIKYFAQKGYL